MTGLEDLIMQSTNRAQEMSELARKTMERLALVEQNSQAASRQLTTEVSETRASLAAALTLLDSLQAEIDQRDSEVHQTLTQLESDGAQIELSVAGAAEALRASNKAAGEGADSQASLMAAQLATCSTQMKELRTAADGNVAKLGGYYQEFKTYLGNVEKEAEEVVTALDKALAGLLQEHAQLDKELKAQIDRLESSYTEVAGAMDLRLSVLEQQFGRLQTASDTYLNQDMVRTFAGDLRKAADSFSRELGQVEKEVRSIASTVSSANATFTSYLAHKLQPNVVSINYSLYSAAQNLGWF